MQSTIVRSLSYGEFPINQEDCQLKFMASTLQGANFQLLLDLFVQTREFHEISRSGQARKVENSGGQRLFLVEATFGAIRLST
jgi:hypothetical protein